jgi:hypothetical protein
MYAYTMQIYYDFSGYTDMALGAAKLFNIELTQNFNKPYLATSMTDFWRKWHISLSSWLRDYLYIPLGGNRVGLWHKCSNILVVFIVCGLWHGASWNFLAWGLLHGLFQVMGVLSQPYRLKMYRTLRLENSRALRIWQSFGVFHMAAFAWIFFRASSISDAFYVTSHLFTGVPDFIAGLARSATSLGRFIGFLKAAFKPACGGQTFEELAIALISMVFIAFMGAMTARKSCVETMLETTPHWLRWTMYYVLVAWIVFFGAFNTSAQFIYLQF